MGANSGIRAELMEYFSKHPGTHVFLRELVETTQRTAEQVQGNISNLVRDHRSGKLNFYIECVTRGQVWMYLPNKEKPEVKRKGMRLFEELGTTKRGTIVIEDDEGNLYEAKDL
jgi:hypothetical protein